MTVCTASIFLWRYGENDYGHAVAMASDRMYTDSGLGIEYESSRTKVASIDPSHVMMVSGDLTLNSRIISAMMAWKQRVETPTTEKVASHLGLVISAISFDIGAKAFLNPLGIYPADILEDTRGLQRYGLPDELIVQLARELQADQIDVEAIVAGCENRNGSIYRVDSKGRVSLHNDVGFVSIGTGGVHSSAYFMQLPYNHIVGFHSALVTTYFAKKRAEIAPGVGAITDLAFVTDDGFDYVKPDDLKSLEKTYAAAARQTVRMKKNLEIRFERDWQRRYQSAGPQPVKPPEETDLTAGTTDANLESSAG